MPIQTNVQGADCVLSNLLKLNLNAYVNPRSVNKRDNSICFGIHTSFIYFSDFLFNWETKILELIKNSSLKID